MSQSRTFGRNIPLSENNLIYCASTRSARPMATDARTCQPKDWPSAAFYYYLQGFLGPLRPPRPDKKHWGCGVLRRATGASSIGSASRTIRSAAHRGLPAGSPFALFLLQLYVLSSPLSAVTGAICHLLRGLNGGAYPGDGQRIDEMEPDYRGVSRNVPIIQ